MKTMVRLLGLLLLLLAPTRTMALIGTIDDVPAATLLLPYFEVDPAGSDTKGVNTLLTISNASATAILSHVTVWTDAAVPVFSFNIYLTGYDQQRIDLRRLIDGQYPSTASAGQDGGTGNVPFDSISPHGPFSQDINFASCTGKLPPSDADAETVASRKAALSGKSSSLIGGCAGYDHGDDILRGFVTADTVNNCTVRKPGDPGYFGSGGSGDATNQNVMWGDYNIVNNSTGRHHVGRLAAIEASGSDFETTMPGQYTFYGRLVSWNASDNREPLATNFTAPYTTNAGLGQPGKTTFLVWRDPKVKQIPFSCSTPLSWFPLAQEGVTAFDEQEHAEVLTPASTAFGLATQAVVVDSGALPVSFSAGFIYLNLNAYVTAGGNNPAEDVNAAQAWIDVMQDDSDSGAYGAHGHLGLMNRAVPLDNASKTITSSHFGPFN